MTDKERLQYILNNTQSEDIESILNFFLAAYEHKMSLGTINELHNLITSSLSRKVGKASQALFVANERAYYLKRYLDGSMWKDEKITRKNLQPQIENAQAIIDECNRVK